MARELAQLRRALVKAGWRVEKSGGGHWKCYAPDGKTIVVLPDTPGDYRSWQNMLAQLRRAGFTWPRKG